MRENAINLDLVELYPEGYCYLLLIDDVTHHLHRDLRDRLRCVATIELDVSPPINRVLGMCFTICRSINVRVHNPFVVVENNILFHVNNNHPILLYLI